MIWGMVEGKWQSGRSARLAKSLKGIGASRSPLEDGRSPKI